MKTIKWILAAIILGTMASCSDDSMYIPITPPSTYYVKVIEIVKVYEITYSDATKTTEVQRRVSTSNSGSKTIYESVGISQNEMESIRNKYQNVTDQKLTDQGTRFDYEWNYSYHLEINKL